MRKTIVTIVMSLLLTLSVWAQGNAGHQNFGNIQPSALLPATCTIGSVVFKTTAVSGAIGLYSCNAANTWTGPFSTGSGNGTVTNTGGALTLNAVMLGAGGNDSKVDTGCTAGSGTMACSGFSGPLTGNASTATNIANNTGTTTTVLHGNAAGSPAFGSVVNGDLGANAVDSSKMAVVNTRRVCDIAVGDTSGAVITDAQLGPQKRICYVPAAATVVEMDVAADGGTPNVIVGVNHAGSVSNIVSSALATASSGGIACSKTTGTTGIDGATTCSATLQNTTVAAGDYLELVSGTAGGVAKLMTIHVIYTIN